MERAPVVWLVDCTGLILFCLDKIISSFTGRFQLRHGACSSSLTPIDCKFKPILSCKIISFLKVPIPPAPCIDFTGLTLFCPVKIISCLMGPIPAAPRSLIQPDILVYRCIRSSRDRLDFYDEIQIIFGTGFCRSFLTVSGYPIYGRVSHFRGFQFFIKG